LFLRNLSFNFKKSHSISSQKMISSSQQWRRLENFRKARQEINR
jgi:hypothetical protein